MFCFGGICVLSLPFFFFFSFVQFILKAMLLLGMGIFHCQNYESNVRNTETYYPVVISIFPSRFKGRFRSN